MEIKSLAHTGFNALAGAFAEAFSAYEIQITPDELRTMLRRRGFDPALSFAAFDITGRIIGFTLNGIGSFGGVPTAYDTGTGTLPDYRGQGLASRIFEASLPHLRSAGIRQYLLEVLQHNTAAVSVYRKLGFEVSREFNYFRAADGDVRLEGQCGCGEQNGMYEVRQVELAAFSELAAQFWDFEPSWQNAFEAVRRASNDFVFLGAFQKQSNGMPGERVVGYAIFEPAAGDITQIGVDKTCRHQGIGTRLLAEMLHLNRTGSLKCINTEIGRDLSVAEFLQAKNIALAGKQFEMIKPL